jgi:hypothetical protein
MHFMKLGKVGIIRSEANGIDVKAGTTMVNHGNMLKQW